jgi:hypothetical protein
VNQHRHSIIKIEPRIHPSDFSTVYLVQIAVDEVPCVPFWSHKIERIRLGEEGWLKALFENAEHMLKEFGRAPALS